MQSLKAPKQAPNLDHVELISTCSLLKTPACAVWKSTFKCEIKLLEFKGNLLQDTVECSCQGPGESHPGSEGTYNNKRKTVGFKAKYGVSMLRLSLSLPPQKVKSRL